MASKTPSSYRNSAYAEHRLFPELLIAFHDQYPEIAVVLEEYGSVRACNLVQDDTLDLALVNMEQYNIDKFNKALLANDQVVFV